MELEWKNFRGFTALEILTEIRKKINEMQCEPEQFIGRIIFMPMYNGIVWWEKWKHRIMHCEFQNSGRICKKNRARTVVVSRAWIRKNSTDQTRTSLTENGMVSLNTCCSTSAKWTFRIPWNQCFGTRSFEKQREWQLSIHFCGEPQTVEVVLRTIISVNQLSVYGTEADMCDELASRISDCSASRRRRSSWIRNSGTDVCITIGVFSALVYSNKAEILVERRRSHEEIPVLLGYQLSRYILLPSSNSIPFWRKSNRSSQHCKTTWCYRATSPSTSTTLEAPTTCTPSSNQDWFGEKISRKGDRPYSSQQWILCTHLHKQRHYDVTKPRIAVYKHTWKIHETPMYWANLRVAQKKGLSFHQTRSNAIILHNTLPAACIEKVEAVSPGEVMKNKMYESLRSPRKVVLNPAGHEGQTDTTSIEERASNA